MNGKGLRTFAVLAVTMTTAGSVCAFDVLRAERNISVTAAGAMLPAVDGCPTGAPVRPLRLSEAVERALCSNPKTREAWADVKAQAAGVGVARAAYLPTVSANWQGMRENSTVEITGHPTLGSDYTSTVHSETVSLNWLLYDFGGREAALRNADALLEAARATQDATLQDEFATVAKDYYAAQTAMGELDAAKDVEAMTHRSMVAAQARTDRGVVPVTDALQAQTQYEQAMFSLTKAESDAQTALGTLASDMNLDPSVPLDVPPVTDDARTDATFSEPVAQMIRDVQIAHPAVRAAQAQYEAALAKVSQTRAQGLPSISLVGRYSQNNQPESMGLGLPTYPATGHEAYIGVQVSIPLFEGFARHYQVDQARAQAERQQYALEDARRQVALDVWSSYQALDASTRNAQNSAKLLDTAQRAWQAAQHRYDAGVGNILELMNTQAALANAKQRRIQSLAQWDNARVDLAAKLGRLGAADLR